MPVVFQKSSHFSVCTLVSDERPIAFKKSRGLAIDSVPGVTINELTWYTWGALSPYHWVVGSGVKRLD